MPTHPSHHDPDDGPAGTTRTRLPDGGSATRRPPARSSRTLVTVVGVVVVLIAALAYATRGPGSADRAGTGAGSDGAPHPTGTAPTGTRPTITRTSGIPTGYPHTREGAQSAAANYAVALGGEGMFNTTRRHEIVAAVAASSAVNHLQSGFDADYSAAFLKHVGLNPDGSAPQGLTFVNRTVPVGAKARKYTSGAASVSVWCTGLFGMAGDSSTHPVTSGWFTVDLTLGWIGKDWKVLKAVQSKGPTPVADDDTVSGANEIANAVQGFGGFTYAR